MPAFAAKEITDPAMEQAIMAKMFPNRNANRIFSAFTNPLTHAQFVKDAELQGQALPLSGAYKNYITDNPKGAEAALHAQFESMLGALPAPAYESSVTYYERVNDYVQ